MWRKRVSGDEKKQLKKLEKKLGFSFKRLELLRRALTHRSYANEQGFPAEAHNERLEFLGDAVLELSVSELLMKRFPEFSEGELSKLRAAIVNEKQLAELATQYNIGEHLLLGRGEEQTNGREKPSLLSDAYEAVLGAAYLDRGFKKSCALIERHYRRLFENRVPESFYLDFKTELQERVQSIFRTIPQYRLKREHGPDHRKTFEVQLMIRDQAYGTGVGHSKKEAEQKAAEQALKKLNQEQAENVI